MSSLASFQLSVISYQLSVISYQLSVISYQLSVLDKGGKLTIFNTYLLIEKIGTIVISDKSDTV
ncbi:MAG: hypothetical protein EWV81_17325 [Microcystis aeruginosa Ma_SC_T_19800800_S464]|uniref:Uncharacterized protein n=1 Tax=Microcystis aeruginosa Ma_SC_T_19800800_S464 TaxID=2486257 RepID=A0A552DL15_MICAE|nr:MAG: hypothetical protein EWV81_17325 [Microcystis aeruginosa Ma_SC_T_19800800_S464]